MVLICYWFQCLIWNTALSTYEKNSKPFCCDVPRNLAYPEKFQVERKDVVTYEKLSSVSSIVVEGIRTVLFFYQDILHKNKTPKYLNTPKKHNKAHKLGDICPDKIADKKNNNFLFKNKM